MEKYRCPISCCQFSSISGLGFPKYFMFSGQEVEGSIRGSPGVPLDEKKGLPVNLTFFNGIWNLRSANPWFQQMSRYSSLESGVKAYLDLSQIRSHMSPSGFDSERNGGDVRLLTELQRRWKASKVSQRPMIWRSFSYWNDTDRDGSLV